MNTVLEEGKCEHEIFHEEDKFIDYYDPSSRYGHGQYIYPVLVCDECEEIIEEGL